MRSIRLPILVTLCTALAAASIAEADWTRRSGNAQNTGNAGPQTGLDPATVQDLKVTAILPTQGNVNATPIVYDDLVVIGDWKGGLYVYDVQPLASPAPAKLLLRVQTRSGGTPRTGLSAELGNYVGVQSTPIVAEVTLPGTATTQKRIYAGVNSAAHTLYCLNLDEILLKRGELDGLEIGEDERTFFCDDLDADGAPVWPKSLAVGGADGNGTYNGTMLFAAGQEIAVRGADGTETTSTHDVIYTPTTGLDCADGQFWAIDAVTGEMLWSFDPVVNGDGQGGTIWTTPAMSADGSLVYIATGDCVGKPQLGEMAESLVALDARTGEIVWHHQRRLIDTADLDIGNGPLVADVPESAPGTGDGCNVVVSTDKDGCIYGFRQERDIPDLAEQLEPAISDVTQSLPFDPLRIGQQRVLYRQCFVPGSLNGGFNAANPALQGRTVVQQVSGYPSGRVGADNANAFAIDACTGKLRWASADVRNGRIDATVASGMLFQASANTALLEDGAGAGYAVVKEVEVVDMEDGELLAKLPLVDPLTGQTEQPTLGGGGIAIDGGRLFIPVNLRGVYVAEVAPGSGASAPGTPTSVIFAGPYPLPLAPGALPRIDPHDPYPLLDGTVPRLP